MSAVILFIPEAGGSLQGSIEAFRSCEHVGEGYEIHIVNGGFGISCERERIAESKASCVLIGQAMEISPVRGRRLNG